MAPKLSMAIAESAIGIVFGIVAILLGTEIISPGDIDEYRGIALIIVGMFYIFLEFLIRKNSFGRIEGTKKIIVFMLIVFVNLILVYSIWPIFGDPDITALNLAVTAVIVLRASLGTTHGITGSS